MAGQVRLQDSAWLAQLAKQASAAASARRSLALLAIGSATADQIRVTKMKTLNRNFITNVPVKT